MNTDKKYGLILTEKAKIKPPVFQATHNVFGNDSDSDDGLKKKPVLLRPSDSVNRQVKINHEKAISEDPTVYQYDEIYESLISKKDENKGKVQEIKKPRYIENLMKTANKRKIENERRLERQIQKEREKEGDEFADKEVFVTSAYKKKLEELKKEEEREKYEEYLESIGDVTKQKDLGGFYRHLYEQKLGADRAVTDQSADKQEQRISNRTDSDNATRIIADNDKPQMKNRNYRKRKISTDNKQNLSDGEIEDSDEEINRFNLEDIRLSKKAKQIDENIDADSDFSIDDSDDEENDTKVNELVEVKPSEKNVSSNTVNTSVNVDQTVESKEKELPQNKCNTPETPPAKKIDIWKKRTVGEVFEQALKRYYERKASRCY